MKATQTHYETVTNIHGLIDVINDYEMNFCRGNILKFTNTKIKTNESNTDTL